MARGNFPLGLYLADTNLYRIRTVSTDGVIRNFAGTGDYCGGPGSICGDGLQATKAMVGSPLKIGIAQDGTVYFSEVNGSRVRRVATSGIISTFAGNGSNTPAAGDGGLPAAAVVASPSGIAVKPDGSVVIIHDSGSVMRMTSPTIPGLQQTDFFVAADDASEVYVFDADGRHLRTHNALTGAATLTFTYDAQGRVLTMKDGHNNVTTNERHLRTGCDHVGHARPPRKGPKWSTIFNICIRRTGSTDEPH